MHLKRTSAYITQLYVYTVYLAICGKTLSCSLLTSSPDSTSNTEDEVAVVRHLCDMIKKCCTMHSATNFEGTSLVPRTITIQVVL